MITQRNNTLDIMKGIGIILVVIYHSISHFSPQSIVDFNNPISNIIMSFAMPMFFIISGYLTFGKANSVKWLKDKFIRFIIPIVIFSVIYLLIENGWNFLQSLSTNITTGFPDIVVWYLWTLILCYGVCFIIENIHTKIPIWIVSLGVIALLQVIDNAFGFNFLKWYGIFFLIGYNVKAYNFIKWKNLMYVGAISFIVIGFLTKWMVGYESAEYGVLGYTNILIAIKHGQMNLVMMMFLMAILGTMLIWTVSNLINKVKYLNKVFIYIGISSIGIYLLHKLFIPLTNNIVLSVVISIGISLVIYELLKRNQITRKIIGV